METKADDLTEVEHVNGEESGTQYEALVDGVVSYFFFRFSGQE